MKEILGEIVAEAAYQCLPSNTDERHIDKLVDYLIANGVTVQEWIPVSEPPKVYYKDLLVYDEMDDCQFIAVYTNRGQWLVPHYENYEFNITHWSYLPEPPKGE